ncbi:hypothetical protein HZB89_00485 [archaeon]|nr:hypothetical protein [archaeon]
MIGMMAVLEKETKRKDTELREDLADVREYYADKLERLEAKANFGEQTIQLDKLQFNDIRFAIEGFNDRFLNDRQKALLYSQLEKIRRMAGK